MDVAITSLGMITSVGWDAVTACASLRASIRRPAEIEYLGGLDDDAEPIPVIGYPVEGFTDGFFLPGRWLRLAKHSIDDLICYSQLSGAAITGFWEQTGLLLVLPNLDEDRFHLEDSTSGERIKQEYATRVRSMCALPIPVSQIDVIASGQVGVAAAVQSALKRIETGVTKRIVVLAVDSYLDQGSLEWLGQKNRLKVADVSTGLIPGEAGACFLLENMDEAARRKAKVQALVTSASASLESRDNPAGNGARLDDYTKCARATSGAGSPFQGDIYADCNGEPWRAAAYGSLRVNLSDCIASASRTVFPSESLGETGAASGAIAVCMAVRSFVRGYARGGQALIVSLSERGMAGAIRLAKP